MPLGISDWLSPRLPRVPCFLFHLAVGFPGLQMLPPRLTFASDLNWGPHTPLNHLSSSAFIFLWKLLLTPLTLSKVTEHAIHPGHRGIGEKVTKTRPGSAFFTGNACSRGGGHHVEEKGHSLLAHTVCRSLILSQCPISPGPGLHPPIVSCSDRTLWLLM